MTNNYKGAASVKANVARAGKKRASAQAWGEAQVKRIAELEAELEVLRGERDRLKAQLETKAENAD